MRSIATGDKNRSMPRLPHVLAVSQFSWRSARNVCLAFAIAMLSTAPCNAENRFQAGLARLDEQTRLEQVCDLEAMERITQAGNYMPDRAKSYVLSAPKRKGHTLTALGAAFRSGGKWYALSFTCTATPNHMKVTAFDFHIGGRIPESKWLEYDLWR